MKAMILAAGRGTRLQHITEKTPKALVQVQGISLLERLIQNMIGQGITSIVINVHHLADQITEFLRNKNNFDIEIKISDESDLLLETGGGILHAASLLGEDEPVIIHNVDIVSDLNLKGFYDIHRRSGALATLAVMQRETSRYLLFDSNMQLHGWENIHTGEKIVPGALKAGLNPFAFSGIHVISPEIFPLITERGSFSIIDTYLRLCSDHIIRGFRHDGGLWIDAGKPDGLARAQQMK